MIIDRAAPIIVELRVTVLEQRSCSGPETSCPVGCRPSLQTPKRVAGSRVCRPAVRQGAVSRSVLKRSMAPP
eukprot:3045265-Rhodomonas_salina.3